MTRENENEFVSPVPCDKCGATIEYFDGNTTCDKCRDEYEAKSG